MSRIREHASDPQSLAESTVTAAEHQFATSQDIARNAKQVAELAADSLTCSSELRWCLVNYSRLRPGARGYYY